MRKLIHKILCLLGKHKLNYDEIQYTDHWMDNGMIYEIGTCVCDRCGERIELD